MNRKSRRQSDEPPPQEPPSVAFDRETRILTVLVKGGRPDLATRMARSIDLHAHGGDIVWDELIQAGRRAVVKLKQKHEEGDDGF
ncbi:MAG: hypothetical protein GY795_24655 [Desulfobacterales bacterium]|nr:hypothetical protein [Desulfobacterales bacterium]